MSPAENNIVELERGDESRHYHLDAFFSISSGPASRIPLPEIVLVRLPDREMAGPSARRVPSTTAVPRPALSPMKHRAPR
jgi:hypothetical protein